MSADQLTPHITSHGSLHATPHAVAHGSFAVDLAAAVELLRGLPTAGAGAVNDAYRHVRNWSARRPWLRAQLVVDDPPGSTEVGYDLLLSHPDGGTVALSAEVDDGVPWLVDHSTHWAASQILSVDGAGLSVAAGLSAVRDLGTRDRQLHERLVDHRILLTELDDDHEPVTAAEIQRAADEFRRRRGLIGRAETLDWLAEVGMSGEAFRDHVRVQAFIARVRERFAGEPARRYLAEHADEFTVRHAAWVTGTRPDALRVLVDGPVEEFANRVAAAVVLGKPAEEPAATPIERPGDRPTGTLIERPGGQPTGAPIERPGGRPTGTPIEQPGGRPAVERGVRLEAVATLTPRLPEPLRAVPAGAPVGPVPYDGGYLAGVVYAVVPPDPSDPEVLDAARDAAFRAWLDERRRTSEVRWFWL
ncbi:TIGR04500 family putative peptide maturation system protein [Streptosporangium sp. NPDC002524]|uniref:TIGR04500 family putative peptide maturation system protein n=1 Tax=Streptosporangium sp. NPDC002524 TaxID=3154537 RepID=UPI00332A99ED